MKPPSGDRARGYIAAYDAVTGKRAWTWNYPYYLLASVLATAGDVVFSGDPEGNFFALDARTGDKLWSFPTGAGHRGSPISYSVGGRQFVATPSGFGSIIGKFFAALWPQAPQPRRGSAIFAFALPEESK
jgi:alcohol dehydrogenase (cytochrome c)